MPEHHQRDVLRFVIFPGVCCAKNIVERSIVGEPVESLLGLVKETEADLLMVGNRGLNTLAGRLLGSVPSDVARKSRSDVLIVHTVR
jgi:nucleotide-binding universal stress UspA family protein